MTAPSGRTAHTPAVFEDAPAKGIAFILVAMAAISVNDIPLSRNQATSVSAGVRSSFRR